MTEKPSDPRYVYQTFGRPSMTVKQLDELAAFVFTGNPKQWWGCIVAGVKLSLALAYIAARERLIAAWNKIQQAEYEQGRHSEDEHYVDGDPLGGQPRPVQPLPKP